MADPYSPAERASLDNGCCMASVPHIYKMDPFIIALAPKPVIAIFYYLGPFILLVINKNIMPGSMLIIWKCFKLNGVLARAALEEAGYGTYGM